MKMVYRRTSSNLISLLLTVTCSSGNVLAAQDPPVCEEDKRKPEWALNGDPTGMGEAVDIEGDWAIVGAPESDLIEDIQGCPPVIFATGVAFLFQRNGTASIDGQRWIRERTLEFFGQCPGVADLFGQSVVISDTRLIVGAPGDNFSGLAEAGSACVFLRSGSLWSNEVRLKLSAASANVGDFFGISVDIDDFSFPPRAIIGASEPYDQQNPPTFSRYGSAYIFEFDGTIWSPPIAVLPTGQANGDAYGSAVALDGNRAVVGAPQDDVLATNRGSAHVFARDTVTGAWAFEAELPFSNGTPFDLFGSSVDIDGDIIAVGAVGRDYDPGSGPLANSGEVLIYERSGSTWSLQDVVHASDASIDAGFGHSVSLDGNRLAVGSALGEKVYLFSSVSSSWSEERDLWSSNAKATARFGCRAAISNDLLVVGAPSDDTLDVDLPSQAPSGYAGSGAAYFFAPATLTRESYCTAKVSSLGGSCLPFISANGTPSITAGDTFDLTVNNIVHWEVNKSGLCTRSASILYSFVKTNPPAKYHGGFLCVNSPARLTKEQWAIDLPCPAPGAGCGNTFTWDFNSEILSGNDPLLQEPGTTVYAQYLFSDGDVGDNWNDGLTDAVAFVICP